MFEREYRINTQSRTQSIKWYLNMDLKCIWCGHWWCALVVIMIKYLYIVIYLTVNLWHIHLFLWPEFSVFSININIILLPVKRISLFIIFPQFYSLNNRGGVKWQRNQISPCRGVCPCGFYSMPNISVLFNNVIIFTEWLWERDIQNNIQRTLRHIDILIRGSKIKI